MVGRKNKTPVCIKVKRGLDINFQPFYLGWEVVYAKPINTYGSVRYQDNGTEFYFDKVVEFEANDITRQIDEYTMFCVDVMPHNNYDEYGDYFVKYRFPEKNGIIKVGLEHRGSASLPKLYYLEDNRILMFDIDYNPLTRTAYIKRDAYLPFNTSTTIWDCVPSSSEDSDNRIRLVSVEPIGYEDYTQQFYRLTFEEVQPQSSGD